MPKQSMREALRVDLTNGPVDLKAFGTSPRPRITKKKALASFARDQARLADLQERLYAQQTTGLLLVLQGMDTSGKDGAIKHVIGGVNPQGVRVVSFKKPTAVELRHHFLWRIRRQLPPPGLMAIFNRSHYEDVLVVRVHNLVPESEWSTRYEQINRFERQVVEAGIAIVKVFLHISYSEQRRRLHARLEDPTKRWKFKEDDLKERALWPAYQAAYEAALHRCSTAIAPWFIVPADSKWYRNWAVTRLLVETLEETDPRYPEPPLDIRRLKAALKRTS